MDLILLHAPSIYDFRKKTRLYGPISDVVPSTAIFEMYPIGFVTIMGYLRMHGFSVRIVNIALRMLRDSRFDVEKYIRKLYPVAFGIDLHWLVHAQGSLELAKIVKKYHPKTPVIFGGLSSSYFHLDLIKYEEVDFVIRGDCAEEPLRQLLTTIKTGGSLHTVPNLTWKNSDGQIVANELSHTPVSLDDIPFDYSQIIRSSLLHGDVSGHMPFESWWKYPIVVMQPWKGCIRECVSCGGSRTSYNSLCNRKNPAYRSPGRIVENILATSRYFRGPIMLLGDLRHAGERYATELFAKIKETRIPNSLVIELFSPASREYLTTVASSVSHFNIEISPESADYEVRKMFGREYSNADLEQTIEDSLELGCKRIDLFFMTGLPGQTYRSVMETIDYCEYLLQRFGKRFPQRLLPCISPLAPFIDPGSAIFENPGRYGYTLFCKTLEEHRKILLQPTWKYMLNYETMWMSRGEIVNATYDAAEKLNGLKLGYGLVSEKSARKVHERICNARVVIERIDEVIRDNRLCREDLEFCDIPESCNVGEAITCRKDELHWPMLPFRFNFLEIIRGIIANRAVQL